MGSDHSFNVDMGRILACAIGAVLAGVAAAQTSKKPIWFKSAKGQFPSDRVNYYTYSPDSMLMSFKQASDYCHNLGMGTELWCPNSLIESQIVYANIAYEYMSDIIDGKALDAEALQSFIQMTTTSTYIGISAHQDGFKYDNGADFHKFYDCKNPLMETKWKFESWSNKNDAKNPWDRVTPNFAKQEKCVVIGKQFSIKWQGERCEPHNGISVSFTRMIEKRMRPNSPSTDIFSGARAICVTQSKLVDVFKPKPLDDAVLLKVVARFKTLREEILKLAAAFAFLALFVTTGGFFCFYCCYCCCCCGAPCNNNSGGDQHITTQAAVAIPPTQPPPPPPAAQQYAPPPPQPVQPVAPQGYYPPPSPQPMMMQPVMQPMMQPMMQPPMGGINLNISNNNTNTNNN